jgi:hypothetical protein
MVRPLNPTYFLQPRVGSLLYQDALGEVGGDDALAVVLTLLFEELPRGHAHHAGFDPLAL